MTQKKVIYLYGKPSDEAIEKISRRPPGGSPPVDTNIDKWVSHFDTDIRELRSDIKELRFWTIATWLATFFGLAALIIGLFTYHANVMQSQFNQNQLAIQTQIQAFQGQMQAFTDYVKAVTQPQPPKPPKPSK